MIELFQFALNSINIGIIIVDSSQRVQFWNRYIERISRVRQNDALGKPLGEICDTFEKKRYKEIMGAVFTKNQSRFCSSKLHRAFVYPATGDRESIRQNMMIEPATFDDETYALIQIDDITNEVTNEHKLTSLIYELKKGYLEVKESEETAKRLAETDPLTKLLNRHGIVQIIDSLFENKPELIKSALMFLDLDGFKSVNDTYGHLTGDNLLIKIASTLRHKIRKNDFVARIGGDEFVVLLNHIEEPESLEIIGRKMVDEIAKPISVEGGVAIQVTVSVGITMYCGKIANTSDFIKAADEAMYCAKRSGKNRFVIARPDLCRQLSNAE
jgi:diguanylate cyclase (GGDEF) domain